MLVWGSCLGAIFDSLSFSETEEGEIYFSRSRLETTVGFCLEIETMFIFVIMDLRFSPCTVFNLTIITLIFLSISPLII